MTLSIAVANAGGMGANGALLDPPAKIREWVGQFRAASKGQLQLNLWIPDPPALRDADNEKRLRQFLAAWGPEVPESAGNVKPPDFSAQCDTFVDLAPRVVSSIMGLYPAPLIERLKAKGIA